MSDRAMREEIIAAEPVESMAALLDIEVPDDGLVPPLWHWLYLLDRRPTRDLGPDGHPSHGIPAPPGPDRRRMFAGGRVETRRPLRIGAPARRVSQVTNTVEKRGRSGPLTFVTVRHEFVQGDEVSVLEEQDLVYRDPGPSALPMIEQTALPHDRECDLTLVVNEVLLFRFSALTYNAHRIHYDQSWASREGYDGLVVHGPLQALMMGELARRHGQSLVGRRFTYRLISPMIGPQTMHALAGPEGLSGGAEIRTGTGRLTAEAAFEAPVLGRQ